MIRTRLVECIHVAVFAIFTTSFLNRNSLRSSCNGRCQSIQEGIQHCTSNKFHAQPLLDISTDRENSSRVVAHFSEQNVTCPGIRPVDTTTSNITLLIVNNCRLPLFCYQRSLHHVMHSSQKIINLPSIVREVAQRFHAGFYCTTKQRALLFTSASRGRLTTA